MTQPKSTTDPTGPAYYLRPPGLRVALLPTQASCTVSFNGIRNTGAGESMANATDLFQNAKYPYRCNEDFWSSTFVLSLMCASTSRRRVALPAFQCVFHNESGSHGEFRAIEALSFSSTLTLAQICHGGTFSRSIVPEAADLPVDLTGLKPDIIIRENRTISLLEVKTIGHCVNLHQKTNYDRLVLFLRNEGYKADLYYLLSAGHESVRDFSLLVGDGKESEPTKLLLWENVLKYFDKFEPRIQIMNTLGNLSNYYENERSYLTW